MTQEEKIKRITDIIEYIYECVNIEEEHRIYIDIYLHNIRKNKNNINIINNELDKIDEVYKEQFEENILINHYKNFKNLCVKLQSVITTN